MYFDGNSFSGIQARHCQTVAAIRDFDADIQGKRKAFLKALLTEIKADPLFLTADNKIRLETLLWGGDEMIFVVPAWCGLRVLHFFYHYSQNWAFNGTPLTHAGGIASSLDGTQWNPGIIYSGLRYASSRLRSLKAIFLFLYFQILACLFLKIAR